MQTIQRDKFNNPESKFFFSPNDIRNGYIFPSKDYGKKIGKKKKGKTIYLVDVRKTWKKLLLLGGVERWLKLYSTRHTFASNHYIQNKDVKGVSAAESMMANMMPRITAVAEAYPELKSDTSFLNIQNELVSIENQVADRREMYNATATNFNKAIQMIPTTFVASIKGCQRRDLFEVQGFAREAPKLFA